MFPVFSKFFHTSKQIVDELCTIVDLGGTVEDVFVHHKIYGQLQAPLHISSRRDVQLFLEELKSGKSTPLKDVTSGYHYHTVSADSGETLDLIGQELGKKGLSLPVTFLAVISFLSVFYFPVSYFSIVSAFLCHNLIHIQFRAVPSLHRYILPAGSGHPPAVCPRQ